MAELSRALWLGNISFGAYIIPVKLHSAVRDQKVHFNLLDEKTKTRLRQQMYCSAEDKPVDKEHIVKGYEVTPGNYIIVKPEELEEIEPEQERMIDISKFVQVDDIDLRYYDRYYFLRSNGNEPGYVAFRDSLKKSGMAGLCSWTMRKKRYQGVVQVYRDVLVIATLRNHSEVKSTDTIKVSETKQNKKEAEIALQLVEALAAEFNPDDYHNDFQDKLKEIIKQKAEGKEIKKKKIPRMESTKSNQLVKTLEKSLEYAKKRKKEKA